MKVLHIITGLGNGGAEAVLYRLATGDKANSHEIIALMDGGIYGERLAGAGIRVYTLGMPCRRITARAVARLYKLVRSLKPDVVQTWMYHADLIGGVVARLAGVRVVWGIRGPFNRARTPFSTRVVIYLCAALSRFVPSAIVCNSEHAAQIHACVGYAARKFVNIPNGYPLNLFSPDATARSRLLVALALPADTVLTGMVARFDPYKDHETLFAALAEVVVQERQIVCLLLGAGMSWDNPALEPLLRRHAVGGVVKLLGPRDDVAKIMAALDLHILSSAAESFPNVLIEAMACGTPCVSTDVGDAALIVGDTGWLVPPERPDALCQAILTACDAMRKLALWEARKEQCRKRVAAQYSLERMIVAYVRLWGDVIDGRFLAKT